MVKKSKKQKDSQELNNIFKSIRRWFDKNNRDVVFVASFVTINKQPIENRIIGYGLKKNIRIALQDIQKKLKKEKDFINWY